MKIAIKSLSLVFAGGLVFLASPGVAQEAPFDAAAYYAGKTVRIQVGFSAGGGTDLQARHFATHWSRFMPGNPRFQVTNIRPNIASANRLYRSPPDGLTLELTGSANVVNQFTVPQSEFRVEENRIIGTHVGAAAVLFASRDFPYATLREAMGGEHEVRMGWRTPTQSAAMRMAVLSEWLKIPMKFIPGSSGTADSLLELERGDTNVWIPGGAGTVWFTLPTLRPGWLKDGVIRPIALMGDPQNPVHPNSEIAIPSDVPYAADLIENPEHRRQYIAMSNLIDRYSKIFMAPPKTPDGMINAFRQSYEQMLNDKEFADQLETLQGDPVSYTPGDVVERDLKQMVQDYMEFQDVFKSWEDLARARF